MGYCMSEDLVANGLDVFSIGRRVDVNWSREVESGKTKFDAGFAHEIIDFYRWWLSPVDSIIKVVADFEKKGYKFDRADELRQAIKLAKSVASLSPDHIAASLAQSAKGQTVPLSAVLYGV